MSSDNLLQIPSRIISAGIRKSCEFLQDKVGISFTHPYTENMDIDQLFPPRPFEWRVPPPNPEIIKTSWRDRLFLEQEKHKYTLIQNEMTSTTVYGGANQDVLLYTQRANALNTKIDSLYRFHDDLPLLQRIRMEYYSNYSFHIFADDYSRQAREEFAKEHPKEIEIINQYITQRKYSALMGLASGIGIGLRTPKNVGNWFAGFVVAVFTAAFLFDPFTKYLTGVHLLDESKVRQNVADGVYRKIQEIEKRNNLQVSEVTEPQLATELALL